MSAQYNRDYRAELRAHGLCIDCKNDHRGPGMRCAPCAEWNRGGPLKRGEPAEVLRRIEAIDTATLPDVERHSINYRRWYWRKKVARAA